MRGEVSISRLTTAWNDASGLALRVGLQVRPQTTFAVTPAIAFTTGRQQAVRFTRQFGLHLAFRVDSQVPLGLAS